MKKFSMPSPSSLYPIGLVTAITTLGLISIEASLSQTSTQANQTIRELLVNGEFEITTEESGNLVPAGPGIWDGDAFSTPSVRKHFGRSTPDKPGHVFPNNGSQMLQFIGVEPYNRYTPGGCCTGDVIQFIDLSELRDDIATGQTSVTAEAFFNATSYQSNTNNINFLLSLKAFTGDIPNTIPSETPLAEMSESLSVDTDLETWEPINFELNLPSDSTYLVFLLSAREVDADGLLQQPSEGYFLASFVDSASVILTLSENTH